MTNDPPLRPSLASHPRRFVGGKVNSQRPYVFRLAEASGGNRLRQTLDSGGILQDQTQGDGVDRHAVRRSLDGEMSHESRRARLPCRVGRNTDVHAGPTGARRHGDDPSPIARQHRGKYRLRAVHRAEEIDCNDGFPVRGLSIGELRHRHRRMWATGTGVVDQRIDCANTCGDLLHPVTDSREVGHVEGYGDCVAASLSSEAIRSARSA
jgi:hypothetical protein